MDQYLETCWRFVLSYTHTCKEIFATKIHLLEQCPLLCSFDLIINHVVISLYISLLPAISWKIYVWLHQICCCSNPPGGLYSCTIIEWMLRAFILGKMQFWVLREGKWKNEEERREKSEEENKTEGEADRREKIFDLQWVFDETFFPSFLPEVFPRPCLDIAKTPWIGASRRERVRLSAGLL